MERVPTCLALLTALHHNDELAASIITSPLSRADLLRLVIDLGDALLFEYERDAEREGQTVVAILQHMALIDANEPR